MRCLNSQQVTPELTLPHIMADMIRTAPAEAEENDGMCELVAPTRYNWHYLENKISIIIFNTSFISIVS